MAAFPTHDDLTLVIVGLPEDDFNAARGDVEPTFLRTLDMAGALGEHVRSGPREERFHAATDLAGYFRRPYGPGWALVGDAGYHLHPITAQGITDAFFDAERVTDAIDAVFAERSAFDDAMAHTSEPATNTRCRCTNDIEFAQVDQPLPPNATATRAVAGNQQAMDDFVSVQAGTLPIPEFFSPDNVGRIMAAQRPPTSQRSDGVN